MLNTINSRGRRIVQKHENKSRLNNRDRERERNKKKTYTTYDNLSEFGKIQVVFIKISKVL